MTGDPAEILLVEDNPNHAELTLRSLRKNNVSDRIHVVRDRAEAPEFIFGEGACNGRSLNEGSKGDPAGPEAPPGLTGLKCFGNQE